MDRTAPAPKNKRPRKRSKSKRRSIWAPTKIPTGIPLTVAARLLYDAGVEGLGSAVSVRKAFHEGKLPGTIRQKYGRRKSGDSYSRIYLDPGPIYDLIGAKVAAKVGATTIDQALVQYYEESPEHNPITALADKIAPSLTLAKKVFLEWHECKLNPFVMASESLRQEKERRAAIAEAASDPDASRCRTCNRLPETAKNDNAKLVHDVTGEARASFDVAEEVQLGEFSSHRCSSCWFWLPSAPRGAMHARLQDLAAMNAPPARDAAVSPTPAAPPSGRTSDGVVPVSGDGDAEEEASNVADPVTPLAP